MKVRRLCGSENFVDEMRCDVNRVVFGPELVMLGPDEQFTQLSLSYVM